MYPIPGKDEYGAHLYIESGNIKYETYYKETNKNELYTSWCHGII